jgi:hypothetical protein
MWVKDDVLVHSGGEAPPKRWFGTTRWCSPRPVSRGSNGTIGEFVLELRNEGLDRLG